MTRPSVLDLIRNRSASHPPTRSGIAATKPQRNASPINRTYTVTPGQSRSRHSPFDNTSNGGGVSLLLRLHLGRAHARVTSSLPQDVDEDADQEYDNQRGRGRGLIDQGGEGECQQDDAGGADRKDQQPDARASLL